MLAVFMCALDACGRAIGPSDGSSGVYLVFAGVERFLIEILRAKDDRFLGPFTLAQLTSVILVAIGIWVMTKLREGASPEPDAYLTTGKKAAQLKI